MTMLRVRRSAAAWRRNSSARSSRRACFTCFLGLATATQWYRASVTSARTQDLFDVDRAHVWHPFTQMRDYAGTPPLIVERAEGNWLVDTDGNRYLDGFSSLWCNVHGHRVPEIDEAIRAQLDRVAHSTLLGSANVPSIELAARLSAMAPAGLDRVFYAENGASAVEIAVKMAYQHWQQ